jgi:hypothetical protein
MNCAVWLGVLYSARKKVGAENNTPPVMPKEKGNAVITE